MKKIIIIFILFLFVVGISYPQGKSKKDKKSNVGKSAAPEWIVNFPSNPLYYTGIGEGKSIELAKNVALNSIASQIRTKISSESGGAISYDSATDNKARQSFTQNININVKEDFEDVELIDTYYLKETGMYWVYYRLNMILHKEKQEAKLEKAKQIAIDSLKKSQNESDTTTSIKDLISGFEILKYPPSETNAIYNGKDTILSNEILSAMQKILNSISISVDYENIQLDKIAPKPMQATFSVASNNGPVINFPLKFHTDKGKLDTTEKFMTDKNGKVNVVINRALSDDLIYNFIASLDFAPLLAGLPNDSEFFLDRISSLRIPFKQMSINIRVPTMRFGLKLIGGIAENRQVADKLNTSIPNIFKEEFKSISGIDFVDDNSNRSTDFELVMTLEGSMAENSIGGGQKQFVTTIIPSVTISDLRTTNKAFLLDSTLKEIKGVSPTDVRSAQSAIDKYKNEYNKKLAKDVFDSMIKQ